MSTNRWAKPTPYGLLDAGIPERDRRPDAPEFTLLIAETSARILEAWALDAPRTFLWLRNLNAILSLKSGHYALPWYLSIQAGDTSLVANSFANIALMRCQSKQRVQQTFACAMDDLEAVFPALAASITELRMAYAGRL